MGSTGAAKDTEGESKGGPTCHSDPPPNSDPGHLPGQSFFFPAGDNTEVQVHKNTRLQDVVSAMS